LHLQLTQQEIAMNKTVTRNELQARQLAPTVVPDKSAEIMVYCASKTCQNSHIAASVLRQIGYANVSVYAGGKEDWVDAGAELEKGAAEVTA
jgi:rhodanese-related sulfurtransferase